MCCSAQAQLVLPPKPCNPHAAATSSKLPKTQGCIGFQTMEYSWCDVHKPTDVLKQHAAQAPHVHRSPLLLLLLLPLMYCDCCRMSTAWARLNSNGFGPKPHRLFGRTKAHQDAAIPTSCWGTAVLQPWSHTCRQESTEEGPKTGPGLQGCIS